jgi:outer membrane protein OmpA-like peptidoglycan-associated protein
MKLNQMVLIFLAAWACACAGPESMIVLVPDDAGKVGALEVKNAEGSRRLDQPGEALVIRDDRSLPETPTPISREEVARTFADALDVRPEAPADFIVYFEFGSNELTPEGRQTMDKVMDAIAARGSQDVVVTGHTDRTGDKDYNVRLSLQRAELVKEMIVARGVAAENIRVTSHGENNPLIPTADDVAEPRNRRVEVIVR